ncbi:MAG TPA: ABC transporter substrate-binding protein, partial [Actinomycetota bacterium]
DRSVQIAQNTKNLEGATVLTAPPTDGAYTNDIVTEAIGNLEELGVDVDGNDFQPIQVTLEEGGV